MKKGFSLIAAIFFIIIVATTSLTALSIATLTSRDVGNVHAREQAVLLAQSATEFAVMAMQSHLYPGQVAADGTRGVNCLERINLNDNGFNIVVDIYYFDNLLGCANTIGNAPLLQNIVNPATGVKAIMTTPKTATALVDVTVTSIPGLGTIPIRYNRRTIQKP